jgi:hypothetical protein
MNPLTFHAVSDPDTVALRHPSRVVTGRLLCHLSGCTISIMFLLRCVFVYSFVSTTWSLRNALKLTALRSRVPALGSLVSQS